MAHSLDLQPVFTPCRGTFVSAEGETLPCRRGAVKNGLCQACNRASDPKLLKPEGVK
jgi:hypothetical protein